MEGLICIYEFIFQDGAFSFNLHMDYKTFEMTYKKYPCKPRYLLHNQVGYVDVCTEVT